MSLVYMLRFYDYGTLLIRLCYLATFHGYVLTLCAKAMCVGFKLRLCAQTVLRGTMLRHRYVLRFCVQTVLRGTMLRHRVDLAVSRSSASEGSQGLTHSPIFTLQASL